MKTMFALMIALVSLAANADGFPEPGLYKVTGNISSKEMPMMARTTETEQCIKENQFIDNPEGWMQQQPGQECDIVSYDVADGSISMEMNCTLDQGGTATMQGSGTYTTTTFQLKNRMNIDSGGMKMQIETDVKGERQGSC